MTPPDPAARLARLPVWTALSELFLDTELTTTDLQAIAEILRQSPFDVAEIEYILRNEVTPAFIGNLMSVAGQWAPWTEDEVLEIMNSSLDQWLPGRFIARILVRLLGKMIAEDWRHIADLLDHTGTASPA